MTDNEIIKACKNCLHYEACKGTYYSAKGDEDILHEFEGEMYGHSGCENFEDKDLINRQKEEIQRLENQVAINKGAMRAYREAFENAHDEAVADFSHFLIDKAKDGSIDICDLPDLVAEWRSPKRKDAKLMKEVGEAFQQGVEGGAEE